MNPEPDPATRSHQISDRFRGYLPVVIDVETGGFNHQTDALLEVAASIISMDEQGLIKPSTPISCHVIPFEGANLEPEALAFNGIDPDSPLRDARTEREALRHIFSPIRRAVRVSGCKRAILVGHNAAFDLNFINAAVERTQYKRNPLHPFSTLDTVSLSALMFGQTVLARAAIMAKLEWDANEAHSAVYDTFKTAELFCAVVNQWQKSCPEQPWLAEKTVASEDNLTLDKGS